MPTLQKTSTVAVIKTPSIGYQGLTINIGNKNGLGKPYSNVGTPLAEVAVPADQAFDLALDRKAINKVVFSGLNLPDCSRSPPASPLRHDEEPQVQAQGGRRDGAEARQGIGLPDADPGRS